MINELALFAGAGGGILGGLLSGWRTICAVERDEYAASVLVARQNDGHLEPFPVWSDVRTFDGKPWRGRVEVVSGGFPCQDISQAGKGAGIEGEKSSLWVEMARIVGEVRPRFVFVENSPALTARGLGRVLGDLAAMGYDAEWGVLGAWHVGAPHKRDRIWIVACDSYSDSEPALSLDEQAPGVSELATDSDSKRGRAQQISLSKCKNTAEFRDDGATQYVADSNGERFQKQRQPEPKREKLSESERCNWWETEPDVGRVADGMARRVDRLRAIGNGQVPAVAALAWNELRKRLTK